MQQIIRRFHVLPCSFLGQLVRRYASRSSVRYSRAGLERLEQRMLLAGDLVGHWVADDLNNSLDNRATVAVWADTVNAINASAEGTPMLVKGVLDGHSVVRFAEEGGADAFLIASTDNPLNGAEDFTVAVVFATDSTTLAGDNSRWLVNSPLIAALQIGIPQDWGIAIAQDGQIGAGLGAQDPRLARTLYTTTNGFNDGHAHVVIYTRSGPEMTLKVDSLPTKISTEGGLGPRGATDVRIAGFPFGANPYSGDIAEVRFYNDDLSRAEVNELSVQLQARYGNSPPLAADDQYAVDEDNVLHVAAPQGVLQNDLDLDADPFTATLVDPALHGTVELSPDGSFSYQPHQDFNGFDFFTYVANDGKTSAPANVVIQVRPVLDPPAARPDAYLLSLGTTFQSGADFGVLANDHSVDGLAMSAELVKDVTHGTLLLAENGSFTFDPQGFPGTTTFQYKLKGFDSDASTGTVTLHVSGNPPPIIINEINSDTPNESSRRDPIGPELYEFIELYNPTDSVVDLSGAYFSEGIRFVFGPGSVIAPGGYFVLTKDLARFEREFGFAADGQWDGQLNNDGENILLRDDTGIPIDQVSYGGDGWATVGFRAGPSLQLIDPSWDNTIALHWRAAEPTPHAANVVATGPLISNLVHGSAQPLENEDLVIAVDIGEFLAPVSQVSLHYRVMFDGEVELPMRDDGSHGDVTPADGRFAATIPSSAYSAGQMVRWYVTATDSVGNQARLPTYPDRRDSEEYQGTMVADPSIDSNLPILYWFVENETRASGGTTTFGGLFYLGEFYDNVRTDVHGQSTSSFPKKSFDVDFNRDHRFRWADGELRVKDINLLTNWADKTKVRNTLAYETLGLTGSPTHFSFPVRVQQNGEFFSVAEIVEDGDDRYLERLGLDPHGALYKMYSTFAPPSGGTAEKKTRTWEDRSDLQTLAQVSTLTRDELEQALFDNLNVTEWVNYLAGFMVTSNHDCCHKNYYFYRDSEGTGEWSILPWDVDLSFGHQWTSSETYFNDRMEFDTRLFTGDNNALISDVLSNRRIRQMYLRRVRTLIDEFLQPPDTPADQLKFEKRLDELAALIDPHDDPDPTMGTDDADLDLQKWRSWGHNNVRLAAADGETMRQAIERVKTDFFPRRRTFVYNQTAENGGPIPRPQIGNPDIEFGQVEFAPGSGNPDEEFITLVNSNREAVDISGWHLSGAIQHTFQPGTVIAARDTLYVSPNVVAFRARAAGPSGGQGLFVQGAYQGHLPDSGGTVNLVAADGQAMATHSYSGLLPAAADALRIAEVHYNPGQPSALEMAAGYDDNDDYEFIELVNISHQSVDLAGVRLTRVAVDGDEEGVDFDFEESTVHHLGPGERLLVVEDMEAFEFHYGTGLPIGGQWSGQLGNRSELITLVGPDGPIQQFRYQDSWYATTDGDGASLEIVDAASPDLNRWNAKEGWAPSSATGGSPGSSRNTLGDVNADDLIDALDIDAVFAHILDQGSSPTYDLNSDAIVDQMDVDTLVRIILSTQYGDTNLDGNVNFADFLTLASHFGTEVSSWSEGDFDGDGKVTFHDFLQLSNEFGFGNPQLLANASRSAGSPRSASLASGPKPGTMTI